MGVEIDTQTQDWIERQVDTFSGRRPNYVVFADTLEQVLGNAAKLYCPLAIVQARPKKVASFGGKALRKRKEHPDPVNQFTDLCGARFIAQTRDQVEAVCEFVKAHFVIDWENSVDTSERLRATEFGYRSVHYIVSFSPGVFPTEDVPVEVPACLFTMDNPRAEVQVRTVLEHAYADVSHDLLYKAGFRVPRVWERKFARLAAVLEDADAVITELQEELEAYTHSYASMTPEEMRERVAQCRFVLSKDPSDLAVAREIAALCLLLADWDTAIEALEPYGDGSDAVVLRDYGRALCGKHAGDPRDPEYARGRAIVDRACGIGGEDADAWLALAESWTGDDPEISRKHFRRAFEADPANERALERYLEAEIRFEHSLEIVDIVRPLIQSALQRCRRRTEIGVDLAAAYLTMGKFLLLLRDPYKSLAAFAKAAQVASAPHQLEDALRALDLLRSVGDQLEGYEWARRMLLLRLAAWRPVETPFGADAEARTTAAEPAAAKRARKALAVLATPSAEPWQTPIVMVAGGCDPALAKEMKAYRSLIMEGFRGFCGTVVSGGTKEGVSGLVGAMAGKYAADVVAASYLPESLPLDANLDRRYRVRYSTPGSTFDPLQPLQAWTDLVVTGVDPADVRLLGINGGPIAAAEYRIALALGATVALVEESGREAARLVPDGDWGGSTRLLRMPADPAMVREFVCADVTCQGFDEEHRETLAREVHEEYRRNRHEVIRGTDPAMQPWSKVPAHLQESNRAQADRIPVKLEAVGCTAVAVEDRPIRLLTFSHDEVELLAEIEHARWVIERLQDGWTRGPRDVDRKVSPYLVSWAELSDEVREWDRQTVRKIPEFLAKVGLEVRRKPGAAKASVTAPRRSKRSRR